MTANIETKRQEHRRFCRRYESDGRASIGYVNGDVRRCKHGRIQGAYWILGSTQTYWHDICNPATWLRAKRALDRSEK